MPLDISMKFNMLQGPKLSAEYIIFEQFRNKGQIKYFFK